jgi:hypothetical protein
MDTITSHSLPWTEDEYLALGETLARVVLLDGSILVSPRGHPAHQMVQGTLTAVFDASLPAGLHLLSAVNVRLGPNRIVIPDLVVTTEIDMDDLVVPAQAVRLLAPEALLPGR